MALSVIVQDRPDRVRHITIMLLTLIGGLIVVVGKVSTKKVPFYFAVDVD